MRRESQLIWEGKHYWVAKDGRKDTPYTVNEKQGTHSTCDEQYADDSVALARGQYLEARKEARNAK